MSGRGAEGRAAPLNERFRYVELNLLWSRSRRPRAPRGGGRYARPARPQLLPMGGGLVVKPFGVAGYFFLPEDPAYRPNRARRVEPGPRGVARSEKRGLVETRSLVRRTRPEKPDRWRL